MFNVVGGWDFHSTKTTYLSLHVYRVTQPNLQLICRNPESSQAAIQASCLWGNHTGKNDVLIFTRNLAAFL